MRLLRVQFTTRRLLAAVAIAALMCGSIRLISLSRHYSEKARRNGILAAMCRHHLGYKVKYHVALSEKYDRAARYPWLAVAPDRPESTASPDWGWGGERLILHSVR